MKPKTLSMFEETKCAMGENISVVSAETCETCECYGEPCDCDRSCDVSDPCQSCVSCED